MPEHWRPVAIAYLVWLMAFTVVEGLGREACRMPTAKWIAAGSDARDRTMRATFRDRAAVCLDETRWYAYAMRALVVVALGLPLAALALMRRRSELVRNLTIAGGLAVTLGSIVGVRWLYDWMA